MTDVHAPAVDLVLQADREEDGVQYLWQRRIPEVHRDRVIHIRRVDGEVYARPIADEVERRGQRCVFEVEVCTALGVHPVAPRIFCEGGHPPDAEQENREQCNTGRPHVRTSLAAETGGHASNSRAPGVALRPQRPERHPGCEPQEYDADHPSDRTRSEADRRYVLHGVTPIRTQAAYANGHCLILLFPKTYNFKYTLSQEDHRMADQRGLTVGAVARQARLRASAIRYYESAGLLPAPIRVSGWRRYDETILGRLAVIELAKRAGF